jgi:hypothetical protein
MVRCVRTAGAVSLGQHDGHLQCQARPGSSQAVGGCCTRPPLTRVTPLATPHLVPPTVPATCVPCCRASKGRALRGCRGELWTETQFLVPVPGAGSRAGKICALHTHPVAVIARANSACERIEATDGTAAKVCVAVQDACACSGAGWERCGRRGVSTVRTAHFPLQTVL